jgi:ABC-2 type transport system ATP-binding protein
MSAEADAPAFAIQTHGLAKTYAASARTPAKIALKGLDLAVPRGAVFGLLGPNGAGKSTLINILAGLVVKTAGQATVWGFDIDSHPREAKAAIGVVPQEINLDPFFTPLEAMELQAGFYGVPKTERRTQEILEAVGLWEKRDAYVRQLSGGMKRRLMVAKAMVHSPPVLILDEPTAGVDVELRRQLWDYVRNLNKQGVTIVLTTHYLEEAQELCDTIAIVNHGSLIACEPTEKLLARLDQKTLVIDPQQAVSEAPESLAGLGVRLQADGWLAVTYRSADISVEALLERFRAAGVSIRDIAIHEPDLEDVFLALTADRPAA